MYFFTLTAILAASFQLGSALPQRLDGVVDERRSIPESSDVVVSGNRGLENRGLLGPDILRPSFASLNILDISKENNLLGITDLDLGNGALLEAFSGNAGNAGYAGSGHAIGGMGGNGFIRIRRRCLGAKGGDTYSGAGGNAQGGNVIHNGHSGLTLINLFSGNAGDGGVASSGSALGGVAGYIDCI